jgi:hypothetical protein
MKPEETKEATEEGDSAVPSHLVFFLPFLRLKQAYTVAGVEFVPLRTADGRVSESLQSGVAAIERILSGYLDKHGKRFKNCVVATIPGRGWDLQGDDFDTVRWSASLLFLAAWAGNEYFTRFGGSYVSSTTFRLVAQRFSGHIPYYITLVTRMRHGTATDGGYKHGELKFHVPLQVSLRDEARIDEELLAALTRAARIVSKTRIDLMWDKAWKAAREKLAGKSDER